MCFSLKNFCIASVAILALGFLTFAGCEPENKNDVGCLPSDCNAACAAMGQGQGACIDDVCSCDDTGADPYPWGGTGSDADSDSDTDTDTAQDSGAPDAGEGLNP